MAVASGDAIEFLEYLLEVLAAHPDAVVGDGYLEPFLSVGLHVAGGHGEMQGDFLAAVFHGVVEQVEDDVGEVHLVDINGGVLGPEDRLDVAAVFLNLELEGGGDIGYEDVGVDILQAQCGPAAVEH